MGTVAERSTTRLEHLTSPAELGTWLVFAGLLDAAPDVTGADLAAAVAVREALYALLRAASVDELLPRAALTLVNRAAAAPPVTPSLTTGGLVERRGGVSAALSTIARSAVALIGGPDRARLRWCADAACTHPFLDRSRGGRRRWCGMAGCGDRAKARAYRARLRTAGS